MADAPETRYARLGEDRVAYQVLGDGPLDLLYAPARGDSLDLRFDWPPLGDFLRRLASFSRLIMFDRRGTGASDSISYEGLSLWEQWADDVRAVLDAVGSERAAILGAGDVGPTAALFAATEPERTRALILFTTSARFMAAEDYPCGLPEEVLEEDMKHLVQTWGTDAPVDLLVPSMVGGGRGRTNNKKMAGRWLVPVVAVFGRLDFSSPKARSFALSVAPSSSDGRAANLGEIGPAAQSHW